MRASQEDINEFKRQLKKGAIRRAYKGLLTYMLDLRRFFMGKYTTYDVSGLYHGYMDMTYFALFPKSLKQRDLKVALLFNYEAFRFEVWLAGRNRKVQKKYWEVFKGFQCDECRVVEPGKGVDAIVESTLAEDFDFDNLDALTSSIEKATLKFIDRIEEFLSDHQAKR